MTSRMARMLMLSVMVSLLAAGGATARGDRTAADLLGSRFDPGNTSRPPRRPDRAPANAVEHWNRVAIDASGLDHTPPAAGEVRVYGEQFGPSARAERWRSCTSRSSSR